MAPTGNPHTDTTMRFHEAHSKERDEIIRLMLRLTGMRAAAQTRQAITKR